MQYGRGRSWGAVWKGRRSWGAVWKGEEELEWSMEGVGGAGVEYGRGRRSWGGVWKGLEELEWSMEELELELGL